MFYSFFHYVISNTIFVCCLFLQVIEGRCRVACDKGRWTRCTRLQVLWRARTWTCRESGQGRGGAPGGPGGEEAACSSSSPRTTTRTRTTTRGRGPRPGQRRGMRGGRRPGGGADVGQGSGASGSGASGPQQWPYLRGPLSLPWHAVAQDRRPTIRPLGAK